MSLLLVGGIVILALIIAVLSSRDRWGWGVLVALVAALFLSWMQVLDIVRYAVEHRGEFAYWCLAYVLVGVAWSFVKWLSFTNREYKRYVKARNEFLRKNNATELTSDLRLLWSEELSGRWRTEKVSADPPKASENKDRLVGWVMLWWASLIGVFFSDWLYGFFEFLHDRISHLYDSVAAHIFKDVSGEVLNAVEAANQRRAKTAAEEAARGQRTPSYRTE